MPNRKGSKPPQRPAKPLVANNPGAGSASVLPMEIQIGDRFTKSGVEWEVLTHPSAMHGAKNLRATVVRPGLLESDREAKWPVPEHEHIAIRRSLRSES